MSHQTEHHMFPMVPCHALPRLHAAITHDLPAPDTSIISGYPPIWPAFKRQLQYEDFFLKPAPPTTSIKRT